MPKNAKLYAHEGETLTLEEWSRRSGISVRALGQRMRFGRTLGEALTAKVQVKHGPRQTWREPANPVLTAWLRRPAPHFTTAESPLVDHNDHGRA